MLPKIVFACLFLYTFWLGIRFMPASGRDKAFKAFVFALVVIPSATFLKAFYFQTQVLYYFGFFAGLFVAFIFRLFKKGSIDVFVLLLLGLSVLLTVPYFLLYFTFGELPKIIDLLKDYKVFVVTFFGFALYAVCKDHVKLLFESDVWIKILRVNFVVDTIMFLLMVFFNIQNKLSTDAYFRFNPTRYEDLGTVILIFFVIYWVATNKKLISSQMFLAVVPIFYSGNRSVILFLLLIILIKVFLDSTPYQKVIQLSSIAVVMLISVTLISRADESSPLYRFNALLNPTKVVRHLNNRFSPYFRTMRQKDQPLIYVIGAGPGLTYYIPWFAHRKNIENYNIYLDNVYLSLYGKYGVFCFLLLGLIAWFLIKRLRGSLAIYYVIFLFLLGITNSWVYQDEYWIALMVPTLVLRPKRVQPGIPEEASETAE